MEVITTHINADFDSLASMLAAQKLYPQAAIVFPGSQEKNLRDFFVQSAFYVMETKRLKSIPFEKVRRLILVDTRQPGRIGKFAELARRPDIDLHIYDHHPRAADDLHGKVEYIEEVGATITILINILREKGISISPEEATIMALGLYEDTGSFTFTSTTPQDLDAGAFLLAQGANLNMVANLITRELTSEQISLLNELIHNKTVYHIKGIEVVVAKATANKYIGDFALLVHKLRDMENIRVLFALAEMEDRIYFVGRSSIPEVNVGEIAALFGGGGHSTAASASIKGMSLAEVEEKLLSYLEGRLPTTKVARDLMSFPVKIINACDTIAHASELLTRYNINVLPVLDKDKLVGLISRQVIEKAAYHGFRDAPVKDYMTSEFAVVHPRTSLTKVQDIIVGHNQRFLPVMDKDKLVGAITRTDLLRWMYATTHQTLPAPAERDFSALQPRTKGLIAVLEERLPPDVLSLMRTIGEMGAKLGYQVYAVGGFVRDLLLRIANYDIDIVVEGEGIKLAQLLVEQGNGKLQVHKKFGTATLTFSQGRRLDIATARLEYYEHPAALPRIEHSSIKLDLFRRDFTVNALAIHLNPQHFGELIDFFGGQRDLKEKLIRVIHNLSFIEDPTRIFRALRFEQRIGFQIARHTQMLIENAVRLDLFGRLSGKRLCHELMLCLAEEKPWKVIKRLEDFNLLKFFHPRLIADRSMENLFQNLEKVISWYQLSFTGENYEKWQVFLLGLVDHLNEKEINDLLKRLALPEKFKEKFLENRRLAWKVEEQLLQNLNLKRSKIYTLLKPLPPEFILYLMGRTGAAEVRKVISFYFTALNPVKILLKGKDLKKLGYKPGPIYNKIFQELLRARLDDEVHTWQEEVAFVQEHFVQDNQPVMGNNLEIDLTLAKERSMA